MPSALELGLAEGDLVDSKLASSLHVAMELLSYVVDKTMKLVDTVGVCVSLRTSALPQLFAHVVLGHRIVSEI